MINRQQLEEIILKNDTKDWWKPELFIQKTKHLLPTELEVLADPPPEDKNYNCFIYALGLHTDSKILQETDGFIYDSFIKSLLQLGELKQTNNPADGDFVVYQDLKHYPNTLTHIGILNEGKVVSKWAWGPLIKHLLWDVPTEYGDTVFYIKSIDPVQSLRLYSEYKSHNIKPST